jgi:fimbrial chaperone protein
MSRSAIRLLRWRTVNVAAALIAGLLGGLVAPDAGAGSIELSPVRVDLSALARIGVLTVRNTGTTASLMQVTLLAWDAQAPDQSGERSDDLVVTPTTFALQPGAQQVVRLGLRGAPPGTVEAAYRLIIEEVPGGQSPPSTATQLLVRHDVPVFIAPREPGVRAMLAASGCGQQATDLLLRNSGNVHLKVLQVALTDRASQEVLSQWTTFEYLLPGGSHSWALGERAGGLPAAGTTVTALTDQGALRAEVQDKCP